MPQPRGGAGHGFPQHPRDGLGAAGAERRAGEPRGREGRGGVRNAWAAFRGSAGPGPEEAPRSLPWLRRASPRSCGARGAAACRLSDTAGPRDAAIPSAEPAMLAFKSRRSAFVCSRATGLPRLAPGEPDGACADGRPAPPARSFAWRVFSVR